MTRRLKDSLILALLFACPFTYAVLCSAASAETTQDKNDNVPYTEYASLRPVFTESSLDEDEMIELTRADVDRVYDEFRRVVVSPPYLRGLKSPADYKIDDAQTSFNACSELCENVNKLIFSVSDSSLEKYGPILQAIRDIVYLDAVCLKEYLNNNAEHRVLWHTLHNKWMSALEERYAALGKIK
jgi:hypothetical protein